MSSFNAQYGNLSKPRVTGQAGKRVVASTRMAVLGMLALFTTSAGGCARRAYNDVYVENMAAEIRDLEDQLYEFDGEYRLMEQQLASLRSENARLKSALPATPNNRALRPRNVAWSERGFSVRLLCTARGLDAYSDANANAI